MSECDSSVYPVSVVDVVVVVVNLLLFGLLSNCCTDLLQMLCGCSLGGPLPSLLNRSDTPIFHGIMGNFVNFLDNP